MHAASSSSRPLSEKTNKPASPSTPTPTPTPSPQKVTRRKGTEFIDDERKRKMTQSKRSEGLIKKAKDDHSLTRVPVTVITFDGKDKLRHFGNPSVEELFSSYVDERYDLKQQVIPKEQLDWAKEETDSCKTKEDCTSLIMKHKVVLNCLFKKWKDLENNPVNAGSGRDLPTLVSTEDSDDHDITLLDSAIASRESSAGSSNPMRSDLYFDAVDWAFNGIRESMNDSDFMGNLQQLLSRPNPKGHENNADHNGL